MQARQEHASRLPHRVVTGGVNPRIDGDGCEAEVRDLALPDGVSE
jgi:hypothetical protein